MVVPPVVGSEEVNLAVEDLEGVDLEGVDSVVLVLYDNNPNPKIRLKILQYYNLP